MILLIDSIYKLDFSKLIELYADDIERDRVAYYPSMDPVEGRLCAENDLYIYLKNVFFSESCGIYYIYSDNNRYLAAARFERYRDGLLLNALVTNKDYRRKGYASMILMEALSSIDVPVYSHISCKNQASIELHRKFGFKKFLDYAVLLDGSVHVDHFTYIRVI